MNITTNHKGYKEARKATGQSKYNGAYYYAKEIEKNIMPRVKTWREWNTVGRDLDGMHDSMIVFLHDNSTCWHYEWLHKYHDLVLVCSSQYTADSVKYSGNVILLPMSVDTEYVKKFRTEKTKDVCFVGNIWVKNNLQHDIDGEVDFFSGLPREELLKELAKYKYAYAIDRCAIEAKVLGCELLPTETRYHVDNVGEVLDNKEASVILQAKLDEIDKEGKHAKENRIQNCTL